MIVFSPCYAVARACGAEGYRQRVCGHRAHLKHNRMSSHHREGLLSDDEIHVVYVWI